MVGLLWGFLLRSSRNQFETPTPTFTLRHCISKSSYLFFVLVIGNDSTKNEVNIYYFRNISLQLHRQTHGLQKIHPAKLIWDLNIQTYHLKTCNMNLNAFHVLLRIVTVFVLSVFIATMSDLLGPNATRRCQDSGSWGNPDLTRCVRRDLQEALVQVNSPTLLSCSSETRLTILVSMKICT